MFGPSVLLVIVLLVSWRGGRGETAGGRDDGSVEELGGRVRVKEGNAAMRWERERGRGRSEYGVVRYPMICKYCLVAIYTWM